MIDFTRILVGAALALASCVPAAAAEAFIDFDPDSAPTMFAVQALDEALRSRGFEVGRRGDTASRKPPFEGGVLIRFDRANEPGGREFPAMQPDGFALTAFRDEGHTLIHVSSTTVGGAMYGGLELAEQIRTRGVDGLEAIERNPHFALRGTKFNLPLDLRSPSYSDMSDAAQANIGTVWDFEFWRAYLDQLARDRYNAVTLWNLHPFPSMVKVPEFPDVALNDVWRSKIRFDEDYSTRTVGLVTPAMLAHKEVVRALTIDQKIAFWRRVMQHARDRNIDVYVVTWNIFTYGVGGKYGIDDSLENRKTRDYFRASVRELFRTYPLLRGIGLTVGENMGDPGPSDNGGDSAFQRKEDWAFATYGLGVMDAARAEPKRSIRLIHRQHEAKTQDIAATFAPLRKFANVEFLFSFKYAQAHALSSTEQTFHRGHVDSLGDLGTLWTIRNDDALLHRWAAPDFVREFIVNMPREKSRGFYVGSDMWIWGRDFVSRVPPVPHQLEADRHWLHTLLWGRLGYDPTLDDSRIAALVGQRFPGVDGARLLAAWQDASMIYPLVTGFHWADFDFQWYIEACRSRPAPARTESGFHSVETFITQRVHPGTDNISIPDYVAGVANGDVPRGTSPLEVARRIDERVFSALHASPGLRRSAQPNAELEATLDDITRMALLGWYYSSKIRGATALAQYRVTRHPDDQALAVKELRRAAETWGLYSASARKAYRNPLWTNRVGIVDWDELDREVRKDVEIAQKSAQ